MGRSALQRLEQVTRAHMRWTKSLGRLSCMGAQCARGSCTRGRACCAARRFAAQQGGLLRGLLARCAPRAALGASVPAAHAWGITWGICARKKTHMRPHWQARMNSVLTAGKHACAVYLLRQARLRSVLTAGKHACAHTGKHVYAVYLLQASTHAPTQASMFMQCTHTNLRTPTGLELHPQLHPPTHSHK